MFDFETGDEFLVLTNAFSLKWVFCIHRKMHEVARVTMNVPEVLG